MAIDKEFSYKGHQCYRLDDVTTIVIRPMPCGSRKSIEKVWSIEGPHGKHASKTPIITSARGCRKWINNEFAAE